VDLLLLDYQLGDGENGLAFYRELHSVEMELPAILVTGFSDEERILEAMRAGVRDFIPKTPNFVDLVAPTVDRVMAQVRQERRLTDAEAASRAKDNFLATLSHELRTPLTPVAALVSALRQDDRLPADVRSDLEVIHRNIALESRLIDDLLDLTRIARGKLELRMENADLRPVLEHALRTVCESGTNEKGVDCRSELAEGPHPVRCDPARLTQVFWNLLKNSMKFTPEGGQILLRSSLKETKNGRRMVVEVRDTGIGIEPDILPRIFGAFEQGDRGITRRFGGLGLGLAISKAIVEAHGGTITAESEGRGKGAAFIVTLPVLADTRVLAPVPDGAERRSDVPVDIDSAHILLVEDHADTAAVLARVLRRSGFRVSVGHSVAEGMARAAEAHVEIDNSGRVRPIELVVSDLGLPDGSGIELMEALQKQYGLRGVALSGFGMDEDVRRALNAGFARHITKPVDMTILLQTIRDVLSGQN
jgi:signal transduction histidine kinase